jgi:hypothetical protein
LTAWISAHIHAFEYFSGVPRLLIPDNLRTGVSRACRYDPDLNPTYQEFAMHYDVGVVPARPGHPKDKAKVEVGVQVVERWILAALRHQKFFRLVDLNHAIRELLERLNQRPFRKREGSRSSVFAAVERNALRPLPAEPFDMSQWSYARVNIDYHIAFDANLYSVPCWCKAVLFYTAGELVAEQIPDYVPYPDKNGLWVRAWLAPDRSLVEKDGKPHLNGSMELQQALSELVDDLASASSHP